MSKVSLVATAGIGAVSIASLLLVRKRAFLYSTKTRLITAPRLKKRSHMVPFGKVCGQNRGPNPIHPPIYSEDLYHYVRDESRSNKEILDHLRAENAYTESKLQHLKPFQKKVYDEMLSHVQESDEDYPYPYGPYLYYNRTVKGSCYPINCRKPRSGVGQEEILLDQNELARGKKYTVVRNIRVSPDHKYLAYLVDFTGGEKYTGHIKDLSSGQLLQDRLVKIESLEWGTTSSQLFYTTTDDLLRPNKVWRYAVGRMEAGKQNIYTDDDALYSVSFYKSRSSKYLFIESESKETSECSILELEQANAKPRVIEKRKERIMYSVSHQGQHLYIVTNKDQATNYKLMRTSVSQLSQEHWQDVFAYDEDVKLESVDPFENFLVLSGRQCGLTQLWIVKHEKDLASHGTKYTKQRIAFNEPIYTLSDSYNQEYDAAKYRFTYCSMTTPVTTYDYDVESSELVLLKECSVPNYDRSLYKSERIMATASDGVEVPMSVLYRKDMRTGDRQPLHLYGYGSYGACMETGFQSSLVPLLNRGIIYVIAHIRGGGEMGRSWYDNGKFLQKRNTFTDFISCAETLVKIGMTSSSKMTCEGRSAGGLLIGAVLNMRPDLFTAALARVPFVDVMNTMSDPSIPLTVQEWQEWGNPNEVKYFSYMRSYSPYENIKAQAYPNVMVTSGLHDPRVMYWEPTKYVAKLRELKSDHNEVFLKMDLESGHFSASDRYRALTERAFEYAFLLEQLKSLETKEN
uniref:Prolyl endopeptidase n=1 Tax=Albugo laibachii Nc14 TaxID=890382 RepID=F0WJY6_9STRA|nr:serine protease family S09A putative [Albugo laibachii Nc14]|eukprot:CCA21588.1 serine protease family S09A putative [Albugo laibachii Nc14]